MKPLRAVIVSLVFLGMISVAQAQDTSSIAQKDDEVVQERIASAVSAAPASVTDSATIKDWPAGDEGEMVTLRKGTNNYTCLPDMPDTPGEDPMCLDKLWMEWLDAWINNENFDADRFGFGYMLQGGMNSTDPYSEEPPDEEERPEESRPHIMILVPDSTILKTLPTTPEAGGPWVMWRGTTYEHLMVPVPQNEKGDKPEE